MTGTPSDLPSWIIDVAVRERGGALTRTVLARGREHLRPVVEELLRRGVAVAPYVLAVPRRERPRGLAWWRRRAPVLHPDDVKAAVHAELERIRPHAGGRRIALLGIGAAEEIRMAAGMDLQVDALQLGWLMGGEGGVAWCAPDGTWVGSGQWAEAVKKLSSVVSAWPP